MNIATVGLMVNAAGAILALNNFSSAAGRARNAGTAAERMAQSLSRALATLGLYFGGRELAGYADTWQLVESRIDLVTSSSQQLAAVQHELFDIANRTRNSFDSSASLYQRLALNAQELGISQRDMLNVVESVNAGLITSGATAVEAAQSIRQLGQAMGAGRLQGDEFRTVMEAMPAVAIAISRELGVATGELYKLSREGEITAQVVIRALLAVREEMVAQLGDFPITMGQAWLILNNELTRFIGLLSQSTGVGQGIAEAMLWLGTNLDKVFAAIGAVITSFSTYIVVTRTAAAVTALMTAAGTIRSFLQLARSVRSAADAMALLSLVSRGVVGAIAAVAALTASYLAYQKLLKELTADTEEWLAGLDSLEDQIGTGTRTIEEQNEALQKRLWAAEDMIRLAQQEVVLAGMTGDEYERQRIIFDALNKTIEENRVARDGATQATLDAIAAERELLLEAQRISSALEEQQKIIERFQENLQRSFGDLFYNIFNQGIDSFSDLVDGIKSLFMRMLAELAAAEFMRRWGTALAGALATVFGGASGAIAQTGVSEGPLAGVTPVILEGVTVTAKRDLSELFKSAAPILATALAGYSVGSMVGGLTTNRAVGAAGGAVAGAAVGAAIGTFVLPGLGTAAGALVGGLAGLVGGFLGATKAAREHREELERIARYQTEFRVMMRLRELVLAGREDEAEVLRLQIAHEKELFEARRDGVLTIAQMRDLIRLQTREVEALRAAQARAHAEERQEFLDDINVRELAARGLTQEANALRIRIAQEKELAEAHRLGLSAQEIARLREIHALEAVAEAANNLARSLANVPNTAPIEWWRQQAFRSIGGSGGTVTSGNALTGGAGTVIHQYNIDKIVTQAPTAEGMFKSVRQYAIEDRRAGGQGLRGTA